MISARASVRLIPPTAYHRDLHSSHRPRSRPLLTFLLRLHFAGEGDVVVDDLAPRHQEHGDGVVVVTQVLVQVAGDVARAWQRVATGAGTGSVRTWEKTRKEGVTCCT